MPFIFYSKSDEDLENLVFKNNIWGIKTTRVKSSLENKPDDFQSGTKILWYSSESNSFFGYSTIKDAKFYQDTTNLISEGYSAFDLEGSHKFETALIRTQEIYQKFSHLSLYYNNYRILDEDLYEKLINLATSKEKKGKIEEEATHNSIVLNLLTIGNLLGCEVWVANDLKNKIVNNQRLGDLSIENLEIPGFKKEVLTILRGIDLLWLKNGIINAGFEVEHTTQIFSGLLRFTDLFLSMPNLNIDAFIVAPNNRKNQVETQFDRITFKHILKDHSSKIKTIYYSSLNLGYDNVQEVYRRGAIYPIKKFLDLCETAKWEEFSD